METKTPDNLTRGYFTPTDGFWNIGAWGYTRDGETWNGWEVPYFTIEDCVRMVHAINDMCENTGDTETSLGVWAGTHPAWTELCDGEVVRHEMATLIVHGTTYYALGGNSLTWSKEHTEHRDDLARLGPDLVKGDWVDIAFELLNSWWSAIDTDDAMELMLSATLDEIIRLAEYVESHSPYLGDPKPYWDEAHSYASRCDWFPDDRERYPRIDWDRIAEAHENGGYWYV